MRACFRRPKYGAAYRNVIYGNPLIVVRARESMMFFRALTPSGWIYLFIPRLPIYHR
jgi:hypothetical protein